MRETSKQRYDRRMASGECLCCGQIKSSKNKYCDRCNNLKSQLWKNRYQELKQQNRCTKCKNVIVGEYTVHCPNCAAKAKRYRLAKIENLKIAVFSAYGGVVCACTGCTWHDSKCAVSDLNVLTLNHINGGGNDHRRSINGGDDLAAGERTWLWLKKNNYPPGFNVLCCNCNWSAFKSTLNADQR